MDISKQFSLTDFLAYFFPGLFSTLGLYLLGLLTPLSASLVALPLDLTTGIIFLVLSYIAGVIFSGFSMNIVRWVEKIQKYKNPRDTPPLDKFQDDLLLAFRDVFNNGRDNKIQWSREHFQICRSLVMERMPAITQSAERQSSLRQLRGNLIFPILIWLTVGISWGLRYINYGMMDWGIGLIVSSTILSFSAFRVTLTRMRNNERREVLRYLLGFLAGYKAGLFDNKQIRRTRAQVAVSQVRATAQARGADKLTPAEVETEIKLARQGRKK